MSEKFHKEVAAFKKENGNASFTLKEMMMYLVSKFDKLDSKLNNGEGKIAKNRTSIEVNNSKIGFLTKLFYVGFGVMLTTLGWIINIIR